MPGRDGTGPLAEGPVSGRGRGFCAGGGGAPRCGAGYGAGHGRRNEFYATGMTGWQRAAQADGEAETRAAEASHSYARLDEKLTEVLVCLERLESARQS